MFLVSSLINSCFVSWSRMSNNYLSTIGQVGKPISWIHLAHRHRTVTEPILHYSTSCHKKRVTIWLVSYLKIRERENQLQLLEMQTNVSWRTFKAAGGTSPFFAATQCRLSFPSLQQEFFKNSKFNDCETVLRFESVRIRMCDIFYQSIILSIRLVWTMRTEFTSLLLHEIKHYFIYHKSKKMLILRSNVVLSHMICTCISISYSLMGTSWPP